jgi:hypothetical protein
MLEHDIGEKLILAEALLDMATAVAPALKFFDDPSRQPSRDRFHVQRLVLRRYDGDAA